MKQENLKLFKRAALSALGVLVYIFLLSLFMNNGNKIFGAEDNNMLAPILFLMLFVFSALVTGFLILGKPIMMYLDNEKKSALKLLFYTGVCLFVLLIITGLLLFLLK
ncbi:MAG: hypothetical protein WC441_03970 [Patescibacteria group bacterium]